MENYKNFENLIKNSKNILIISHINPDGDTLGCMCGLFSSIYKRFKKKAEMLIISPIPKIYEFLPHIKFAKNVSDIDKSREYDLVITVDVAALDRIVDAQILFNKAKHTINIDHHKTNDNFGEVAIVKPEASSASEVLFDILKELNWEIDSEIATSLYVGILTDTGGFKFENTTSKVLNACGELIDKGVNPNDLYKKCYESKSKEIILFQSHCINNAKFENNDKIAYSIIYNKDLEKYNVKNDATDGIAETLRSMFTTEVSFVAKEIDSKSCKVSMRSKKIDVAKICSIFGGGGHKFAAGCTAKYSVTETAKKLIAEINKEL